MRCAVIDGKSSFIAGKSKLFPISVLVAFVIAVHRHKWHFAEPAFASGKPNLPLSLISCIGKIAEAKNEIHLLFFQHCEHLAEVSTMTVAVTNHSNLKRCGISLGKASLKGIFLTYPRF